MLTQTLAAYIATSGRQALPEDVAAKARLHLIDTIAAILSGSRLAAGQAGALLTQGQGGHPEAAVLGTGLRMPAGLAALANGMSGHGDETDDSHAPSLTHPGCVMVPAALAMAERHHSSGADLLRAVVLGYDLGTRMSMALGGSRFADTYHLSSHGWGGTFGATAAAASLAGLGVEKTAHALSHAVQMAAGNRCWIRDLDHVQKAFIFGGRPAQAGIMAATMAEAGITGAPEPIEGTPGLLAAFPLESNPAPLTDGLGARFEIMRTSIKKWCVGSPIQAALDAMEAFQAEDGITTGDIAEILVTLPAARAQVVNSPMPNINLVHLLAVYLLDGGLSFATSHDHARMADPAVLAYSARIRVESRPGAARGEQAEVTLLTTDGRRLVRRPLVVRGQPGNPMAEDEVMAKALDLTGPVLGDEKARRLIGLLRRVEDLPDLRSLSDCWTV